MKLRILFECPKLQYLKLETVLEATGLRLKQEENEIWLVSSQILPSTFSVEDTEQTSEIWEQVQDLVTVINGAAKLEMQDWSLITLKNMQWEDNSGASEWFPITASVCMFETSEKVRIQIQKLRVDTIAKQDRTKVKKIEYHSSALYLAAAGSDESVAKALRLINRKMDWTNLYRILDVIQEDAGGYQTIEKQGWTTQKRIKTFTGSANNSSVSGDDSRHGYIQSGQPKQTMDLRKARNFIYQLLRKWLTTKVQNVS